MDLWFIFSAALGNRRLRPERKHPEVQPVTIFELDINDIIVSIQFLANLMKNKPTSRDNVVTHQRANHINKEVCPFHVVFIERDFILQPIEIITFQLLRSRETPARNTQKINLSNLRNKIILRLDVYREILVFE